MTYDYLVTLKKQDYRFVDLVSQLLYFFALAVFGYFYYHLPKSGAVYLYIGIGILLSWIFTLLKKRRNGKAFFRFGLLIAAVGWFIGPARNVWMAILYALAGIIEKQVKFPQEIGFSDKEITFNTLPKKTLHWAQVKNVLIKDGLLTIDQNNNKLFQKEIEGYVTDDLETEFNNFCRSCIVAANSSV